MMRYRHGEYDNYNYPEPLKKETPETREKLRESKERMKMLAARHHKEAEKRNNHFNIS